MARLHATDKSSRAKTGVRLGATLLKSLGALTLLSAVMLLFSQDGRSFTADGCGSGECRDCHSLSVKEAKTLMGEMVDKVHGVEFAEVPGLWLVEVEQKGRRYPVFIDYSKSYLISGNVVRLKNRENITATRMMQMNRVDISSIPLADALLLGRPGAKTKAIVFTDPLCPFCDKLHVELKKVVEADPDIAFYIKLLPLVKLHPESYRISQSIICKGSMDLLEDSFAKKTIPDPDCPAGAVDANIKLARELGINSTPTLILPDGLVSPGYKEAPDILQLLGSKAGK